MFDEEHPDFFVTSQFVEKGGRGTRENHRIEKHGFPFIRQF